MIEVFQLDKGKVVPTKEILLIEPFKTIWNRDTDSKKPNALKEFAYIEFMTSYKQTNPFIGYGKEERHRKICNSVMANPIFVPDDLVRKGMIMYMDWQDEASPTLRFYKAMVKTNEKVIKWAETVDLSQTDKKGSAVYKPAEVMAVIAKGHENIRALSLMKTSVEQEINDSIKRRNNRQINHFEMRPEERKVVG